MMHRDRVNPIKINCLNVFSERLSIKYTTNYFESHYIKELKAGGAMKDHHAPRPLPVTHAAS
jgi:hypothetical protein